MKLQMMNEKQYFITLPNSIIRAKEWQKGDELTVKIDNQGNIVIKKI